MLGGYPLGYALGTRSIHEGGSYYRISYGGSERDSYVGITGGKVVGNLALGMDVGTVADAAARYSDMRSEVTCSGGGVSVV